MIKNLKTNKELYFSIFKAVLPGVLFLIVLFSLFSLSNNEKLITSLMNSFYEGTELEVDNWEVSTVFYDSTVNDGTTPLTNIDWDASDGGFELGETRTITVQINYKNNNCQNDFAIGDLNILVPSLVDENSNLDTIVNIGANDETHTGFDWSVTYDKKSNLYKFTNDVVYEKNTNFEGSIMIKYIMTPKREDPEKYEDECLHELNRDVNAVIISSKPQDKINIYHRYNEDFYFENSDYNFYLFRFTSGKLYSGNNEIIYETLNKTDTIKCNYNSYCWLDNYPPIVAYDFIKVYFGQMENNESLYASVDCYDALAISNNINFSYKRKYIHPWIKYHYDLTKEANKVKALDGIENASDYYWVDYKFSTKDSAYAESYGLDLYSKYETPFYIYDELPDDVVVYVNGNLIEPYENNTYRFEINGRPRNVWGNFYYATRSVNAYVGYPKSHYNGSNMQMTNEARLYAMYGSDDEYTYQSSDSIDIDLNDFKDFSNEGLYSVKKATADNYIMGGISVCGNCGTSRYYQAIAEGANYLKDGNLFAYEMNYSAYYSGKPLTVKLGDDYLSAKTNENIYEKLSDNEYYFNTIKLQRITNAYGNSLIDKYNWKLYVRRANSNSYELYKENLELGNITFNKDDKVVAYYIYAEDLKDSIFVTSYVYINVSKQNIATSGYLYNYAYSKIYFKDVNNLVLQNADQEENYNNLNDGSSLKEFDMNNHNSYIQRAQSSSYWSYFTLSQPQVDFTTNKYYNSSIIQDDNDQSFTITYSLMQLIESQRGQSYVYNEQFKDQYDESYRVGGYYIYDLLPEGMNLLSSKEEILDSLDIYIESSFTFRDENFELVSSGNDFKDKILRESFTLDDISVINNWKGTNRTLLKINVDFSNNKLFFFGTQSYNREMRVNFNYDVKVSYDDYLEYGNVFNNEVFMEKHEGEKAYYNSSRSDYLDLNENNDSDERLSYGYNTITLNPASSTNQDVQVSVQSDISNYNTGKVDVSNDSEYSYKLRVRTGSSKVTNLVIYDSLEMYAKDTNMEFINASSGYNRWQGTFNGVDTSYAESKGYNVKVYYSEKIDPDNLADDDSWQLYTDSVDKSKVKSLAFQYLDDEGNPAVLPTDSLTYVLIKMISPNDENIRSLAYNGCWTEWNAIDPLTNQTVDFITGINSNIVKVALPNSVEPVDIDLNIDKYWVDNNNQNFRPDTINIQVVPNGDVTKAIDVPLGSTNIDPTNPLHWSTTVSVPKYDYDGNLINYSLREGEIILEDGYKYTPTIEDNTITNTLMKEIELKKIWKDNDNGYFTRPNNVTYMVKQNGNDYKEVTFTGDYSNNIWTKKITVPVFDSTNNEYTYTVEEVNIDNYSSNCEELICTNTLAGNKNISITKEWNDKDNEYSTRPDNITVNLLRNGTLFKEVNIDNTNWMSNSIEVPIYDNEGVKYNYTISENNIDEYGLVEYDQVNFKVINTLKKRINLVIKKIWVDDNNSNNTRPDELTITLLRDNEEYQTLTLSGDTNEWTTTVEVDKYDNNLNKYKYSIREVNDSISDLYSNVTYSEDELTVINTLSQNTSLTISKKWIDHNNEYLTRPDSIKVNLLQNDSVYREITLSKDKNWKEEVTDIPVYDSNQNKYTYTIEESVNIPKYGKITYDQTNFEITNELTEVPTVSLYFTVVNGYIDPVTGEMKYDDFGLNEILKKYDKTIDDEYIFTFELKNLDSGNLYDGKLSTQGILEFKDIPYGDYKAVEGEDNLFDFVDMLSIEEVNGVRFRRVGNEGYISIRPTGEDIVFGAKIVNKITAPIDNPNTGVIIEMIILLALLLPISYSLYLLSKTIKSQ